MSLPTSVAEGKLTLLAPSGSTNLGNLSPAAGGDSDNPASLSPSAGGNAADKCANTFLDAGWAGPAALLCKE